MGDMGRTDVRWLVQVLVSLSFLTFAIFFFYVVTRHVHISITLSNTHAEINEINEVSHLTETPQQDMNGNKVLNIIQTTFKPRPKDVKQNTDKDTQLTNAGKEIQNTIKPNNKAELDEPTSGNKTRYLIYLCDKRRSCGGWSDRQRGLVGAYLLAIVSGRRFGINMSVPCDIKLFYVPNQVNWYIKTSELLGLTWEVVDWMQGKRYTGECRDNFNKCYPSDVVFLRLNIDIGIHMSNLHPNRHILPDVYKKRGPGFGHAWNKLMKPSIHMEEHIDKYMNQVSSKEDLICAHVRMRRNPTMPRDAAPLNSISAIGSLWNFLSKYEKKTSRVFIASDSMEVRESAKKRFGVKEMDTKGVILHIDTMRGWSEACLGFETSLLDQILLSKCKVLVVSGSGFGIRAAMMSHVKQELFQFKNGTILPFRF